MKRLGTGFKVIPSKEVREEFRLTYELKGAQRAVDFLARHYGIRRMRISVDGRRVGNSDEACYVYETRTAYFKRKAVDRSNVLHEFYHHLAYVKRWELSRKREEREAERYTRETLGKK